jgi:hypothetical protein
MILNEEAACYVRTECSIEECETPFPGEPSLLFQTVNKLDLVLDYIKVLQSPEGKLSSRTTSSVSMLLVCALYILLLEKCILLLQRDTVSILMLDSARKTLNTIAQPPPFVPYLKISHLRRFIAALR